MSLVQSPDISFLISFIIVTVLYGSLISPQISRLANIRDKIADQRFPIRDYFTDNWTDRRTHENAINEARKQLEGYFFEYELKYSYLKPLLNYFWLSIGSVILVTYGTAVSNTVINHSTALYIYGLLEWVLLLLFILDVALNKYVVDEDTIRRFDWLANKVGINQFSLLRLMNGKMYLSNNKDFFESADPSDLIHIHYRSDINITGYKYYLQVSDNSTYKVYFLSYGPIGRKTKTMRSVERNGEYAYDIDLGSFKLNSLKGKSLTIHLYVFANAYKHSEASPYYLIHYIDVPNDNRFIQSYGSAVQISIEREDEYIKFNGEGYKLNNFTISANSLLNVEIFNAVNGSFEKSKRVVTVENLDNGISLNPYKKINSSTWEIP